MTSLFDQVSSATRTIQTQWNQIPKMGIILGTGLGGVVQKIQVQAEIPYSKIPHFPISTAPGHQGRLICGILEGMPIVAMDGRFHAYEGYSLAQITLPVRVLGALGCTFIIISNACGGMNPLFKKGDIMIINDHINLIGDNPLIGPNDERLGVRFPDMSNAYDHDLRAIANEVALQERIKICEGVYAAVTGPCLETRAEYRYLRHIGSDVVGMSTVPEVIVANHAGLKVLGLSIITDLCFPDALQSVSVDEIIRIANEAEKPLSRLVCAIVKKIRSTQGL